MTHCAECGYDLTGLTPPHRCPECGLLADPEAQRAAAVAWYASWRGLAFWRPPPQVARYLDAPRCRRIARRRLILGVVLPWLLSTLLLVASNGVVVVTDLLVWWEHPSQPGVRLGEHQDSWEDHPFDINLHPGDGSLPDSVPVGATRHGQFMGRRLAFHWPSPTWFTPLFVPLPTAAVLLYLPTLLLLHVLAVRRGVPTSVASVLAASYAAHYALGAIAAAVAWPLSWLVDLLRLPPAIGWIVSIAAWGALALLAFGPPRLFARAWRTLHARLRPAHSLARGASFVGLTILFLLVWFGCAWIAGRLGC